jgi:hypothetical protein
VYYHIGRNLAARCYWDEAERLQRQLLDRVKDDPVSISLRSDLARVLEARGDIEGALALFRENARIGPDQAGTHLNLGVGFTRSGKFAEALESYRRGQQVAVETRSRFRGQAEKMVREAEREVEVDRRLEAGRPGPATADESLEFAEVCFWKKRYAEAVGFYRRAFDQGPKREGQRGRYRAACAAALAAAGQGGATEPLDAPRRADLRRQALAWLRADLDGWARFVRENPKIRWQPEAEMRRWQRHPNLASLRDPPSLARLPDDERQACERLWADVNALLAKVQAN